MRLADMLSIGENEIITVVGAGGKTSFIKNITNHYRSKLKVLLTTTTNIYLPCKYDYENIFMLSSNPNVASASPYGITLCGKYVNDKNKVVGLDFKDLDNIHDEFELIVIEGDGSKCKKIKGWNDTEPVVYNRTTKTVGILDITSYNMEINDKNIHRLDRFIELTSPLGNNISILDLKNIVLNKNGLFKNAVGKKILFINKVENSKYEKIAKELIEAINKETHDISIFYGSVKENFYYKG